MSQRPAVVERPTVLEPVDSRTPPGQVTIEIRDNIDLDARDAAALKTLIDGRPEVGVFVSPAWLSGFFADPPRNATVHVALFREGADLRGIAPLAVLETSTHVRVGLLGGGLGSDRVDLVAARGFEVACSNALVSWLSETFGRKALIVELRGVPAGSPLWGAVYRQNAERSLRLALQPREIHILPYLDLAMPPSRQMSRASSLAKHRRWLERRGRLRIELLQEPFEALAAFDMLTRLLHTRWAAEANGSVLDCSRTQRFHRHVIPLLLASGHLRMIRLSSDVRTISIFYGLATKTWWGYYLCGYDRRWAGRIHLGRLTLAAAIELAMREGVSEFDFLEGVEPVKYLWPVCERSTLDGDVYAPRSAAQLKRAAWATGEAASAFARSARELWPPRGRA